MLPKSYLVFKWLVYASATLLFFALQSLVLNHIRVLGSIGVTDRLHTVALCDVPYLEGQVCFSICRTAPGQGHQKQCYSQNDCCYAGNLFHNSTPLRISWFFG